VAEASRLKRASSLVFTRFPDWCPCYPLARLILGTGFPSLHPTRSKMLMMNGDKPRLFIQGKLVLCPFPGCVVQ
jgi:hypothetical protein